jgi:hypothetical protein
MVSVDMAQHTHNTTGIHYLQGQNCGVGCLGLVMRPSHLSACTPGISHTHLPLPCTCWVQAHRRRWHDGVDPFLEHLLHHLQPRSRHSALPMLLLSPLVPSQGGVKGWTGQQGYTSLAIDDC